MKITTKKILLFLVIVIGLAVVRILFLYNKPHTDITKEVTAIETSSEKLLKDFEADESKANTVYLEQIIQVTGTITAIEKYEKEVVIVLSEPDALGSIRCHMLPEEHAKLDAIKKGRQLMIKGVCTGYLMDVVLIRCVLVP